MPKRHPQNFSINFFPQGYFGRFQNSSPYWTTPFRLNQFHKHPTGDIGVVEDSLELINIPGNPLGVPVRFSTGNPNPNGNQIHRIGFS